MFWFAVTCVVVLVFMIPYFRFLFKRIELLIRIKRTCAKYELDFFATHKLWFLGKIKGKNCDFYIVSKNKVFSVKLAQAISKRHFVAFCDPECYELKSLRFHLAATRFSAKWTEKHKEMNNFEFGFRQEWVSLEKINIMLFNPVGGGIYFKSGDNYTEIWNGDSMGEALLYNSAGFCKMLELCR